MARGGARGGASVAAVGGVGCCVILIVASILIGISVSVLEPNEVGLKFSGLSMELNTEKLFEAGTYFIGVNNKFIKFPRTVQTIKYGYTRDADGQPIPCRTQDGLPVSLSFAFNYRLTTSPQTLAQLYIDYGEMDAVALAYHRTARNVVRSVASRYSAFYFFFDRASIQLDLQGSTNAALASLGASVEQFQLLDVTFPAEFNDARTRQENAVQQIAQATNERAVAVINAQTRVERAAREAALILSNATAEAEASKLRNQAAVATLIARYTAERESYRALKSSLGLSSQELLTYIWLEAQAEGQSSQTLNVQTPPGLAV